VKFPGIRQIERRRATAGWRTASRGAATTRTPAASATRTAARARAGPAALTTTEPAVLVGLHPCFEEDWRDGLFHERIVEPLGRAALSHERGAVDAAEIRRQPDVVFLRELDEFIVHVGIADTVEEAFDARLDHPLGVVEIEDVADRAQPEFLRLVGGRLINLRRDLFLRAVAIVDPDLHEIGLVRREVADSGSRFVGSRDRIR